MLYSPPTLIRILAFSLLLLAGCATGSSGGQFDGDELDATDGLIEEMPCADAVDGEHCGEADGMICLRGECVPSRCGDGFVDEGEECDDGNSIVRDGCENDCTTSCRDDSDCDDGNICNGIERCIVVGNGSRGGGKLCVSGPAPQCGVVEGDGVIIHTRDENPCVLHYCDPDAPDLESACQVEAHEIFCYPDEDEDGFPVQDEARKQPTVGLCECPPKTARQRADRRWDCNDKNPMVRPDLEPNRFFEDPYCADGTIAERVGSAACTPAVNGASCAQFHCADGSTPSFDYDCDGELKRLDESTGGRCTFVLLGCSGVRAYEVDSPVPCGGEAEYTLCESGMLQVCDRELRRQECR